MDITSFIDTIKEKGAAVWLRLSNKWKELSEKMQHKHRLVVMDTDTLKETFSWELTGLNIFTFAGITVIVLLILSSLLIAFTPMRNLVPGFIKPELKEEVARNAQTIDSLENIIDQHEQHIAVIQDIINGKSFESPSEPATKVADEKEGAYRHSKADSLLRKDIEQKHKNAKKK
ncbi:MAG: hypothetical protein MJZ45_00805 [Bacteroidales bacterium]|nr:hypothetical protein [Bacteroidales bacterium]